MTIPARSTKKSRAATEDLLRAAKVPYFDMMFKKGQPLFVQGEAGLTLMYILEGAVKLSAVSPQGREAVIAVFPPGAFIGEGGLAGQPLRMATATAMSEVTVMVIHNKDMLKALHTDHELSDRFLTYMLERNIHVEEDLINQHFNSTEKRLARTLLLLARFGSRDTPQMVLPNVTQETLAAIVGSTRPRISALMNKFKKQGFIKYDGGLEINSGLLSLVLHE